MHSVRLEHTKLILTGKRITYQATGDAGSTTVYQLDDTFANPLFSGIHTQDSKHILVYIYIYIYIYVRIISISLRSCVTPL